MAWAREGAAALELGEDTGHACPLGHEGDDREDGSDDAELARAEGEEGEVAGGEGEVEGGSERCHCED